MTVLGVLCCLQFDQVMGYADTYRINNSHFRFGRIEAYQLLLLGIFEVLFGLTMITKRQYTEAVSWVVIPAWILSLAWWALLFPRSSILQLCHHPYLANGWITFFWGSAYWLTVFVIIRLYHKSHRVVYGLLSHKRHGVIYGVFVTNPLLPGVHSNEH